MKNIKFTLMAITAFASFALVSAPAVYATDIQATSSLNTEGEHQESVTIPIGTIERGDRGSEKVLAEMNVENGEYEVRVVAKNQKSVHPDNDIIVRSGGDEVTIPDVESEAFAEATANGSLFVSDGKVIVYLKFGKDKVFSGGIDVILTKVVKEELVEEEPQEPEEEPEVLSETDDGKGGGELEPKPEALPKTGMAANIAGAFAGVSGLGYALHRTTFKIRR